MTRFTSDIAHVAGKLDRGLVLVEADGTISWVNEAAAELLDLAPGRLLGRQFVDLVHREDQARHHHTSTMRVVDGNGRWRRLRVQRRTTPDGAHGTGFEMLLLEPADEPGVLDLDALPSG